MVQRGFLQRSVAVILLSGQLSGCMGWRAEHLSPADVVERQRPGAVRVQYADGYREVLYDPEVRGDSLVGRGDWSAKQRDRARALTDVREVATRHISASRTAALLLVLGTIVVVIAKNIRYSVNIPLQ